MLAEGGFGSTKLRTLGRPLPFYSRRKCVHVFVCVPLNTVACPIKATNLHLLQKNKYGIYMCMFLHLKTSILDVRDKRNINVMR